VKSSPDEESLDSFFAQGTKRFEPMIPFDQDETITICAYADWCSLAVQQNVLRQFQDPGSVERPGSFDGNPNLIDLEYLFLEHGGKSLQVVGGCLGATRL
jgi:hypothetical protein